MNARNARNARAARALCASATLAALLAGRAAAAQDVMDAPVSLPGHPTAGPAILQKRSYWELSADERPFMAAMLEAGAIFYRPNLMVGYGKPFWSWVGLEGYANIDTSGGFEYVGLRAALPLLEIRGGARYVFAASQSFLASEETFTREDVETASGPRSRYVSAELEVAGAVPFPGGVGFVVLSGYSLFGVPDGYHVYEEALHMVAEPPLLLRLRTGLLGELDRRGELRLGASVEVLHNPGRRATMVRLGPTISINLTHHLDALGSMMLVASTPDTLGLLGADLSQLALRYKWATGDRWPEFP